MKRSGSHCLRGKIIVARRWALSLTLGICVLATSVAQAQSLEEALSRAYSTNPSLLAERQQLEATNENVPQALANWRPTVQLNGQAVYERQLDHQNCKISPLPGTCQQAADFNGGNAPSSIGTMSTLEPSSFGATLSQPLYRGGRTVAQTAQAMDQVRAERARLVSTEQTVFASVIQDYLQVVEIGTALDLNINNEQLLRRQLIASQVRYQLGELTHTDVRLAEAAYAQAIASRHEAEGQLAAAREAYQHDVGEVPLDLKAPRNLPELPASREEAMSLAAVSAPTVVQAQYAEQAAEDTIDLVRGQLLPSVTLQLSGTRAFDYSLSPGLRADDYTAVASASLPLYEGGAIYSQSRAAQKNVSSLKNQADEARRVAVQAAAQAWDGLRATELSLKSNLAAVRANEFALAGLQEEEKVGTRTLQDVLIQQETLFQAYTNYVAVQYQELIYKYNLVQAVGRMTARNFGLPVDYYDPDKEFEYVRDKWIGFGTGP